MYLKEHFPRSQSHPHCSPDKTSHLEETRGRGSPSASEGLFCSQRASPCRGRSNLEQNLPAAGRVSGGKRPRLGANPTEAQYVPRPISNTQRSELELGMALISLCLAQDGCSVVAEASILLTLGLIADLRQLLYQSLYLTQGQLGPSPHSLTHALSP